MASKLCIVTPCSRPENLPALRDSIDWDQTLRWLIAHDAQQTFTPPQFDHPQIEEFHVQQPSFAGHGQRNHALKRIREGFVYFLDDDNIVHPSFWGLLSKFRPGALNVFCMEGHPDPERLDPAHPGPNTIDTAMFCFDRRLAGDLRWLPHLYDADGVFAQSLLLRHPESLCVLDEPAAYYNRLNQEAPSPVKRVASAIETARIVLAHTELYPRDTQRAAVFALSTPGAETRNQPFADLQIRYLAGPHPASAALRRKTIFLRGSGERGRRDLAFCRAAGLNVQAFLAPGNSPEVGKIIDDLPVLPSEGLAETPRPHVFVSSTFFPLIEEDLVSSGFRRGRDFTTLL